MRAAPEPGRRRARPRLVHARATARRSRIASRSTSARREGAHPDRVARAHVRPDPRHARRGREGAARCTSRACRRHAGRRVFGQWKTNGVSAWKIPLLQRVLEGGGSSGKGSIPWTPESVHDFMHAKVVVADDTSFVGSFNFSRSGERNAENVLEIRDAESPTGSPRSSTRSAPATPPRRCRRDRSARALARARPPRQARLRRALTYCGNAVHARSGRARRRRRRRRRRADGRPRLGPPRNAIRPARDPRRELPPGPHLEARVDAFEELRVVDFGDAPVVPADPEGDARADRAHGRRRSWRRRDPGRPRRRPLDHGAQRPRRRSSPRPGRTRPLRHAHGHRNRGLRRRGLARDADVPARPRRHRRRRRYVQIGLRGYWPGETEFAWQREHGITSFFMHDVRDLGIREVVERTSRRSATVRSSSPSTSTCSTRRSRRERARPSRAG